MSSLMALTRTLDWFRPTSRAISVRLKPACASFRSCRSSSVVQGERLISSPPSRLYCFCSGGRGLSAGSGGDSGAPSAAGTAPLSPAASAQSPAQIFVPLTVPTSLQPISVCDFCCALTWQLSAVGIGRRQPLKSRPSSESTALSFAASNFPLSTRKPIEGER